MVVGIIIAILVLGLVAFIAYGSISWSRTTTELRAELCDTGADPAAAAPGSAAAGGGTAAGAASAGSAEASQVPAVYQEEEIAGLPAPVQRFFRTALTNGQAIVHAVHMRHSGTFNMGQGTEEDQWKAMTAEQIVRPGHPGFLWNARIRMLPILPVHVHDAYIDGNGLLHGALFGAVTVMEMRDTPEIARGEFLRYLAESAWYPTALLPSQGADWEPVDESSARVTLTDPAGPGGGRSVTMLFRFNDDNLIDSVYAEERGAEIQGRLVPTPWEGRWWSYEERDGMMIPTEGEVSWLFPERRKPYWRGTVEEIRYEFADDR